MKDRTRGGLRSLSYMTVSVSLFILSLGLTLFLLIRSVITAGSLGRTEGILGAAALLASAAGWIVPLYGHFIVRIDGKADWRIGALMNGVLMLFLVFLYFLGIS